MTENTFGHVSELHITAEEKNGRTILSECDFTAPFKIMKPFENRDGSIAVMLLQASAGIMEGDRQLLSLHVKKGARLTFLSQSYDKVHPMNDGWAERRMDVHVESGGCFCLKPQPMIPYTHSKFKSHIRVDLDDESAKFSMSEILTCGRLGHNEERFQFDLYKNLVEIRRGGKLIYRDNTKYQPAVCQMDDVGMYEGWTHMGNLFLSAGCGKRSSASAIFGGIPSPGSVPAPDDAPPAEDSSLYEDIWSLLDHSGKVEGGVTVLNSNDLSVKLFGNRAQDLEQVSDRILRIFR